MHRLISSFTFSISWLDFIYLSVTHGCNITVFGERGEGRGEELISKFALERWNTYWMFCHTSITTFHRLFQVGVVVLLSWILNFFFYIYFIAIIYYEKNDIFGGHLLLLLFERVYIFYSNTLHQEKWLFEWAFIIIMIIILCENFITYNVHL